MEMICCERTSSRQGQVSTCRWLWDPSSTIIIHIQLVLFWPDMMEAKATTATLTDEASVVAATAHFSSVRSTKNASVRFGHNDKYAKRMRKHPWTQYSTTASVHRKFGQRKDCLEPFAQPNVWRGKFVHRFDSLPTCLSEWQFLRPEPHSADHRLAHEIRVYSM